MTLGPISAHIFVGKINEERRIFKGYLAACPRVGDTLRYNALSSIEPVEVFARVTEVIWCLNEEADGEPIYKVARVNIRAVPEK